MVSGTTPFPRDSYKHPPHLVDVCASIDHGPGCVGALRPVGHRGARCPRHRGGARTSADRPAGISWSALMRTVQPSAIPWGVGARPSSSRPVTRRHPSVTGRSAACQDITIPERPWALTLLVPHFRLISPDRRSGLKSGG